MVCIHINSPPEDDSDFVLQFSFIRNAFASYSDVTDRSHIYLPRSVLAVEKSSNNGTAIGIVRLVIQSANIKKTFFRTPRPFVRIGLRSDPKVYCRTSVLKERT